MWRKAFIHLASVAFIPMFLAALICGSYRSAETSPEDSGNRKANKAEDATNGINGPNSAKQ